MNHASLLECQSCGSENFITCQYLYQFLFFVSTFQYMVMRMNDHSYYSWRHYGSEQVEKEIQKMDIGHSSEERQTHLELTMSWNAWCKWEIVNIYTMYPLSTVYWTVATREIDYQKFFFIWCVQDVDCKCHRRSYGFFFSANGQFWLLLEIFNWKLIVASLLKQLHFSFQFACQ